MTETEAEEIDESIHTHRHFYPQLAPVVFVLLGCGIGDLIGNWVLGGSIAAAITLVATR